MRRRWRRLRRRLGLPGVYRIVHADRRRLVLTMEPAGIRRHWTRYLVLPVQEVERFQGHGLIDVVPPSGAARRGARFAS